MNPFEKLAWMGWDGTDTASRADRLAGALFAGFLPILPVAIASLAFSFGDTSNKLAWLPTILLVPFAMWGYIKVVAMTSPRNNGTTVEYLRAAAKIARLISRDRTLSKSWRKRAKLLARIAKGQLKRQAKLARLIGTDGEWHSAAIKLENAAKSLARHSLTADTGHADVILREIDATLAAYQELEAA